MPAKLVVVDGGTPGTEFWIEEEVLRIGSDANCRVRLDRADVPPHAATLEFRDGGYIVHNRSDATLAVDGQPVAPRGNAALRAGSVLQLVDGVAVQLTVDGSPAPAKRPAWQPAAAPEEAAPDAPPDDDEAPAAPAAASKTLPQLAVVAVCIVLLTFLLTLDTEPAGPAKRSPRAEFHALITELDKAGEAAVPLRSTLQSARIAELHGDRKVARELYGQVRNRLLLKRSQGEFQKADEQLWEFVRSQLSLLTGGSVEGDPF